MPPSKNRLGLAKTPTLAGFDAEKIMGITNTAFELFDNLTRHGPDARRPQQGQVERVSSGLGEWEPEQSSRAATTFTADEVRPTLTASALQAYGLELGPWDEPVPRRIRFRHGRSFDSNLEIFEAIGDAIKRVYAPVQVNVATWDAAHRLDKVDCNGQIECGTAKCTGLGTVFKFVVFCGPGLIKWRGGGVGCTGNIRVGDDHILFGDPRYGNFA
ncbi:unnamed protein product [Scytosiphon promiscuus]